jgi:hypothetical protein
VPLVAAVALVTTVFGVITVVVVTHRVVIVFHGDLVDHVITPVVAEWLLSPGPTVLAG